jgi:hypothetical protein
MNAETMNTKYSEISSAIKTIGENSSHLAPGNKLRSLRERSLEPITMEIIKDLYSRQETIPTRGSRSVWVIYKKNEPEIVDEKSMRKFCALYYTDANYQTIITNRYVDGLKESLIYSDLGYLVTELTNRVLKPEKKVKRLNADQGFRYGVIQATKAGMLLLLPVADISLPYFTSYESMIIDGLLNNMQKLGIDYEAIKSFAGTKENAGLLGGLLTAVGMLLTGNILGSIYRKKGKERDMAIICDLNLNDAVMIGREVVCGSFAEKEILEDYLVDIDKANVKALREELLLKEGESSTLFVRRLYEVFKRETRSIPQHFIKEFIELYKNLGPDVPNFDDILIIGQNSKNIPKIS